MKRFVLLFGLDMELLKKIDFLRYHDEDYPGYSSFFWNGYTLPRPGSFCPSAPLHLEDFGMSTFLLVASEWVFVAQFAEADSCRLRVIMALLSGERPTLMESICVRVSGA